MKTCNKRVHKEIGSRYSYVRKKSLCYYYNLQGYHLLEVHRNSQKKKKILYIDDPLRLGEKIEVSGLCPDCHSIHVSKGQCESCGLQLWVDIVGQPFDERSFFTLKDDFESSLGKLDYLQWRFWPNAFHSKSEVKRYMRFMVKRYSDLVTYLSSENIQEIPQKSDDHIRLFIFEAKEIMKEYAKFTHDLSALFIPLKKISEDSDEVDAITNELMIYLYQLDKSGSQSEQLQEDEGMSSNWELIRTGMLFEALITISAITLASYLVMKYLAS